MIKLHDSSSKRNVRTIVKPNIKCELTLIETNILKVEGILENISSGGACIFLGEKCKTVVSENMKGTLSINPYTYIINDKITVIWSLFNRIGIIFDNKISDDIIKYYQK